MTRRIDTFDPVVITITYVQGGNDDERDPRRRALAGHAPRRLAGRSHARARRHRARRDRTGRGERHGCDVHGRAGISADRERRGLVDLALDVASELLGDEKAGRMPAPVMGAEDFSYVLEQRPGAMAFLGVCPPGTRPTTRMRATRTA